MYCTHSHSLYQSVPSEPTSAVGTDADGVLPWLVGGEREPTLGSIVSRENHFRRRILYLEKGHKYITKYTLLPSFNKLTDGFQSVINLNTTRDNTIRHPKLVPPHACRSPGLMATSLVYCHRIAASCTSLQGNVNWLIYRRPWWPTNYHCFSWNFLNETFLLSLRNVKI